MTARTVQVLCSGQHHRWLPLRCRVMSSRVGRALCPRLCQASQSFGHQVNKVKQSFCGCLVACTQVAMPRTCSEWPRLSPSGAQKLDCFEASHMFCCSLVKGACWSRMPLSHQAQQMSVHDVAVCDYLSHDDFFYYNTIKTALRTEAFQAKGTGGFPAPIMVTWCAPHFPLAGRG